MPHPYWPLFDLRLRTERLELRLPTDDDIVAFTAVAKAGIHPDDFMPFYFPWTREPKLERTSAQFLWRCRAEWSKEDWHLPLMVTHEGRSIGSQGIQAKDFLRLRAVSTGSWLGSRYQGRGLGKEMRAAVLHLAFAGLGAKVAYSGARLENMASLGVSRALGYEPNGLQRAMFGDEPAEEQRLRLTREAWESSPRIDVEIVGLEACREMFGCPG